MGRVCCPLLCCCWSSLKSGSTAISAKEFAGVQPGPLSSGVWVLSGDSLGSSICRVQYRKAAQNKDKILLQLALNRIIMWKASPAQAFG